MNRKIVFAILVCAGISGEHVAHCDGWIGMNSVPLASPTPQRSKIMSTPQPTPHHQRSRTNCDLSDRDYGIEALCLFADDSARAGHWPTNPVAGDAVSHYAAAKSDDASLMIATGKLMDYFKPRIAEIRYCYSIKKIDLCSVYHTR
jgi:hypothetical protein